MRITINKPVEFDVKYLKVDAGVLYWDNGEVNGIQDTDENPMIPGAELKDEWRWKLTIDMETGQIANWPNDIEANVCYKVCDDGIYELLDKNNNVIAVHEGYVPKIMCPEYNGFGDYIIMNINKDGLIKGWNKNLISEFKNNNED